MSTFVGLLELLSNAQLLAVSEIGIIVSNDKKTPQAISDLRARHMELQQKVRPFRPKKIFEELQRISASLETFNSLSPLGEFGNLLKTLQYFDEAYQDYIEQYSSDGAANLMRTGDSLFRQIGTFLSALQFSMLSLADESAYSVDQENILELRWPSAENLRDVESKLHAIGEIYAMLAKLFNVSIADHPLTVRKIESGSLLLRVAGFKVVIRFVAKAIERVSSFVYRNYTNEGKFEGVRIKANAFAHLIELKKSLEDSEIDTAGMDEEISKAAMQLLKNFNDLLQGQTQIQLNGRILPVNDGSDSTKGLGVDQSSMQLTDDSDAHADANSESE